MELFLDYKRCDVLGMHIFNVIIMEMDGVYAIAFNCCNFTPVPTLTTL